MKYVYWDLAIETGQGAKCPENTWLDSSMPMQGTSFLKIENQSVVTTPKSKAE